MSAELAKVVGAQVGQCVLLPIAPQIFDRVEFGRVGRQVLEVNAAMLGAHEVLDESTAMLAQTVPDNQQLARQSRLQLPEEVDYLRTADRSRVQAEVEI